MIVGKDLGASPTACANDAARAAGCAGHVLQFSLVRNEHAAIEPHQPRPRIRSNTTTPPPSQRSGATAIPAPRRRSARTYEFGARPRLRSSRIGSVLSAASRSSRSATPDPAREPGGPLGRLRAQNVPGTSARCPATGPAAHATASGDVRAARGARRLRHIDDLCRGREPRMTTSSPPTTSTTSTRAPTGASRRCRGHPRTVDGVTGTTFGCRPNASRSP